jgi:hypothetical protein
MAGLDAFLLSLKRLLCRFVARAAQGHQLYRSSTKAILEFVMGRIFVRPYRCVDCDSPSVRAISRRPRLPATFSWRCTEANT